MPRWRRVLLGAILGAIIGAVIIAVWALVPYPQSIAHGGVGQQDSGAIATGIVVLVLIPAGAIIGCIVGAAIGLILHKNQSSN